MAEFCSARSNTISPPQWTSLSPPFTEKHHSLITPADIMHDQIKLHTWGNEISVIPSANEKIYDDSSWKQVKLNASEVLEMWPEPLGYSNKIRDDLWREYEQFRRKFIAIKSKTNKSDCKIYEELEPNFSFGVSSMKRIKNGTYPTATERGILPITEKDYVS